ncbi:hypothetical protein [Gorillibacterium timonense]|uniref:hypothetical protein n=1 Tax=Gorillibacterium timonense TaxID=1689269 RepID=UPI00071D786F|nr:hypothetical protein [Gorillibacterium timonense]
MENKFKEYMGKLRDSASQFLSDKREDDVEGTEVELELRDYTLLQSVADERRTTVKVLVDQAIRAFLANEAALNQEEDIQEERKRANPLLALDGIARRNN